MAHRPIFAHIGYGHLVNASYVYAVLDAKAYYTRKFLRGLKREDQTMIFNLAGGKDVKAVLLLDNGQIILSHISSRTLRYRLSNLRQPILPDGTPGEPLAEVDEDENADDFDLEDEEEEVDEID